MKARLEAPRRMRVEKVKSAVPRYARCAVLEVAARKGTKSTSCKSEICGIEMLIGAYCCLV